MFRLGDRLYAVELDAVREVVPFHSATRLPGAPPHVAGLANVRGTIVTLIDLGAQLAGVLSARVAGTVMLVERRDRVVGVVVDEVMDVQALAADGLLSSAQGVPAGEFVRALVHVGGHEVTVLDLPAILGHVLL